MMGTTSKRWCVPKPRGSWDSQVKRCSRNIFHGEFLLKCTSCDLITRTDFPEVRFCISSKCVSFTKALNYKGKVKGLL